MRGFGILPISKNYTIFPKVIVAFIQLPVDIVSCQCVGGEFGEGESVIWLDDVVCGGEEMKLADCSHAGWGEHNCVPSENIVLRCSKK